jgi:hypothetical protein
MVGQSLRVVGCALMCMCLILVSQQSVADEGDEHSINGDWYSEDAPVETECDCKDTVYWDLHDEMVWINYTPDYSQVAADQATAWTLWKADYSGVADSDKSSGTSWYRSKIYNCGGWAIAGETDKWHGEFPDSTNYLGDKKDCWELDSAGTIYISSSLDHVCGVPLFLVPVVMRVFHTYPSCLEEGGA